MDVFAAENYREFIKSVIDENKSIRGFKAKLSSAAGCQQSYLSMVLGGHADFKSDHVIAIADFLGLSDLQAEFFVCLVDIERAKHPKLRKILLKRKEDLKKQAFNLSERIKMDRINDDKLAQVYYSSWHYAAIHVLCSIPSQDTHSIAEKLNLPITTVEETLIFLEKAGICKRHKDYWVTDKWLHVPKNSIFSLSNAAIWRQHATFDFAKQSKESIHYTQLCSMSQHLYQELCQEFLALIEAMRAKIGESKEEELVSFNLDFYKLY